MMMAFGGKIRRITLLGSLSLLLLAAACGSGSGDKDAPSGGGGHSNHGDGEVHTVSGDLQETTASASALPKFLDGQPEQVRLVYQAAGQATELLSGMPCYCGCMESSAGHKSNMNCFVHEVKEDGSVVWDDHGTRCGVCLQIAAQSISMLAEGKTPEQIRESIEAQYKAS